MMTSKRQCRISKYCSLGSLVLLFVGLALLLPATARGQAGGAINGTVRDSSGGVIPDANRRPAQSRHEPGSQHGDQ